MTTLCIYLANDLAIVEYKSVGLYRRCAVYTAIQKRQPQNCLT